MQDLTPFINAKSEHFEANLEMEDFKSIVLSVRALTKPPVKRRRPASLPDWLLTSKEVCDKNREESIEVYMSALAFLIAPLLKSELSKLIKKESLREEEISYNAFFNSGWQGVIKGVNKYDSKKDSGKSSHYIVRWFSVYARRDMERVRAASLGIKPSKYQVFKKIAAVRLKLSENLGRVPSSEEILEYFHSGKADMTSREKRPTQRVKSNQSITLEDIEEQDNIYRAHYMNTSSSQHS